MARSKEDKAQFIASLRAGVELMKSQGVTPPSNLLDSFSPNNALMILFQRPNATQCAGFHAWREAGRAVRKGAKGIAILVPLGTRVDDEGNEWARAILTAPAIKRLIKLYKDQGIWLEERAVI